MGARQAIEASYRDPAGFVLLEAGTYKRAVTEDGAADFEAYVRSGLHAELARDGLTLDFEEEPGRLEPGWTHLLTPEQIEYISYPYEWTFEQLKDAALLTLEIQQRALRRGFSLKDASAFNVQFRGARPVFIDTLSFEADRGGAWIAYEQFCRHFLGPLMMMSYGLVDATKHFKTNLDGLAVQRVSRVLPNRSWLKAGALLHIHLHARAPKGAAAPAAGAVRGQLGYRVALAESLARAVRALKSPAVTGHWADYYEQRRFYSAPAFEAKRAAVRELMEHTRPRLVFDLGANVGLFAREAVSTGARCVAFDSDVACVNQLYVEEREQGGQNVLPLVMDLANPSPALGFGLRETLSLFERPQADLVLSLALIHHLRFTANLPLRRIANCLPRLGRWLLIEYVPREDAAAAELLHGRTGFDDYTAEGFRGAFEAHYQLHARRALDGSGRELYLFERRA